MDDLFNFNGDNILGTPKNINTPQASLGSGTIPISNNQKHDTINNANDDSKTKHEKKKAFKVVIVGDPQVGKTSFLTRHLNDSFDQAYRATIGSSTFHLQFNTNLDTHKFEVLDVAGQNVFAGNRDQYYSDICGAIIMYDVMNWGSYSNVTDIWLRELRQKAPSGIPIVVVGNKMENRDTRAVSVEVVAEAISNEFEPQRIGYCEISVKTNQNLAEPFLFLTKRLLNIHDSKALYFVSKISELNLIESMLQQKDKKQNKQQQTPKMPSDTSSVSKSQNLDDLFLNDNPMNNDMNMNNNNNGSKKGGDYLDDIIFKIGDDDTNKNKKQDVNHTDSKTQSLSSDDNFLQNMMANKPTKTIKTSPKLTPQIIPRSTPKTATKPKGMTKAKSITPKLQSLGMPAVQPTARKQRSYSTQSASPKATTAVLAKNKLNNFKKAVITSKPKQPSRSKAQQIQRKQNVVSNDANSDVMIDILLGIQESINTLTSEVRRLQNDVNNIKQEMQRGRGQRR